MNCPNCDQPEYQFSKPCPRCQFNDAPKLTEELNHIEWLLNEIDTWQMLSSSVKKDIQQDYIHRKKDLEIELGLRLPPFTQKEARQAWPQLVHAETLLQKIDEWLEAGLLNLDSTQMIVDQTRQRIDELWERLEGHVRPATPPTETDRLNLTNFLLEAVEQLKQNKGFATAEAEETIRNPLLAEQERLEINLGLRPEPVVKSTEEERPVPQEDQVIQSSPKQPDKQDKEKAEIPPVDSIPLAAPVPSMPAEPAIPPPSFRERLWQILLSERTLQAMLFLGIFLLFAAALSFVAWGWKDFSAPLRVAIPTGFTGIFFGLGWYVRTQTPMYRSGIALSAIAALLVPIDFYTVYVNFNIPANFWPYFWLITSGTCLFTYIMATFIIRNQFFGYLVGTAAGSTVLAFIEIGHQTLDLSLDWRSAGLSALALGLIILATTLAPPAKKGSPRNVWQFFTDPFRFLSLLTITVIMLLTFGWRYLGRNTYDTFHYAVTINWWLGGFIFSWGAIQYRSRGLGLLAAITLPVATYLAQAVIFNQAGINPAWHAFGWALLVPLYFIVGYKLLKYKGDSVLYSHGRVSVGWGTALLFIAAFWSLTDLSRGAAAAGSHAAIAGAIILASLLWRQPTYLYGASVFSFSATTFAMTELDLTLAQLSVGWASLAIAHVIIALNVGTRVPIPVPNLAGPLVKAGYLIAAIAILPTLFPYNGHLLAYTLGNWLALTGWGARLAHLKQPGFVDAGIWRKPIFHWFTAVPLPIWVWILFSNAGSLDSRFPLALAILAWGMILLSYRLTKASTHYRRPWSLTGGGVSLVAPMAAFIVVPNELAPGFTLLLIGLLYFVDAIIHRQAGELVPAGLVTAWGYVFVLNRLLLPRGVVNFGLTLLIAFYFLSGLWAERKKSNGLTKQFLTPLYLTGHFLSLIVFVQIYLPPLSRIFLYAPWTDEARLWGASSQIVLAIVYGVYAWSKHQKRWGHLATWLVAAGSSFIIITYSTAKGSSIVTELAFVAGAFILVERCLYQYCRPGVAHNRKRAFIRFTWQLFRQPLLVTGWTISAGVVGLSLVYNLGLLGGGRIERIWASVALLLITGLYALSAGLFRQARFVWLAASLSFIPWTILTSLRWFTTYPATSEIYVLSWVGLAWLLFLTHVMLKRFNLITYAPAPKVIAHILLSLTLIWSLVYATPSNFSQAVGLLLAGSLYFADAVFNKHSIALAPGVLITGWGYLILLNRLNLSFDALGFALILLIAFYILVGLWIERQRLSIFTHRYLSPMYLAAHLLTLGVLWQIYVRPFDYLLFGFEWTDRMRMWGATGQLVLGVVYGIYAWGTFKQRWGHFAVWLITFSGAFIAITYTTGRGSSAAETALGAIMFVLVERWLRWLWLRRRSKRKHRQRAFIRLTWRLYRQPLLVAGWTISAAAIGLALVRNLWLLGDGQIQKIWAIMALLLVVGLYAVATRLFRQARFLWLAAPLSFAPWTILTHLGWFTSYRPTLSGYALSWALLAWGLLLINLALNRYASRHYGIPLKLVAHLLIPFSLLWGIANVETSRFTFGLAVGFYGLAGVLSHRHSKVAGNQFDIFWKTKFFYPALGLIPIWCTYLVAWLLPTAQSEHYGLMLLIFGPLGLIVGQGIYRSVLYEKEAAGYALPAYLAGYTSLAIGTMLVAHKPPLLALVFLFDAILMLVSARLFRSLIWIYLAIILTPLSLLLALQETAIPISRYGWWLIGLASVYLLAAWLLHRVNLSDYGSAILTTGLILIALSLLPSSLNKTGAVWGYGSAATLYTITAFWLSQPLLFSAANALAIVPYAVMLQNLDLAPQYYGAALFPGAVAMLSVGRMLDHRFGAWLNFPWAERGQRLRGLIERLCGWWALSPYTIGFGFAMVSPFFTQFKSDLIAFNFFLMMLFFGWATYRFRLRGWLVATVIAGHCGMIYYLDALDWWKHPDLAQAWFRFLPVTIIMSGVTLFIERYRRDSSPLSKTGTFNGWSHPLYIILLFDIIAGQMMSLGESASIAASLITLTHMILIMIFASFWRSSEMAYLSVSLGVITLTQWLLSINASIQSMAMALAQLALAYGLIGYGLALIRDSLDGNRELRPWLAIWEVPLQEFSLSLSLGTLVLTSLLGVDIIGWTIRAILGVPFRHLLDTSTIQMVVGVLGFIGLLYVAISFTHQWSRLGYVAIGMLLTAWTLHVFYIQEWDEFRQVQWYAIPVGLYLLGIAYMEWQRDNRAIAPRLDYLAIVLMLGSLFWQTLLFGWGYALFLGSESLAAFFWGSGRRLRRFLYAGMVGVILATIGQLLNSLRSINQWIVFGLIGSLLVLIAIIVERKLEDIKSWQEILETWE